MQDNKIIRNLFLKTTNKYIKICDVLRFFSLLNESCAQNLTNYLINNKRTLLQYFLMLKVHILIAKL